MLVFLLLTRNYVNLKIWKKVSFQHLYLKGLILKEIKAELEEVRADYTII